MTTEIIRQSLSPDNPYAYALSEHFVNAQTNKGIGAQLTDLFYEKNRFHKVVVPAQNVDDIVGEIKRGLAHGDTSIGIATCYRHAHEGYLTSPWWINITREEDIDSFLHGEEPNKGVHWNRGYLSFLEDRDIVETVITYHPLNYGEHEKRNFVARFRALPEGGMLGEMTVGTLNLRELEGHIDRGDLISLSRLNGSFKLEFELGENMRGSHVKTLVSNVTRKVLYEWQNEPVSLLDYFDVIKTYGFDIVEIIGRHDRGRIEYMKVFEVR